MLTIVFLTFIVICFLSYDKFPKRFIINKSRFIFFVISIFTPILWYIDNINGKFNSGLFSLIIVGLIGYWILIFVCEILNFCVKTYLLYKDSKKLRSSASNIWKQEMTSKEAREILNVKVNASNEEIMNSYIKLIANNDPHDGGSPYIWAKIENAKKLLMS